ncbi:MAG: AAA family ATPase [Thermodesulfobacteriota bacterium]
MSREPAFALSREPFGNHPDPELFYPAPGQVAVLQDLELHLRLRRGLAVVLGPVGVGKTTVCRRLLRDLDRDGPAMAVHLLAEPSAASPRAFLDAVARAFGLPPLAGGLPDRAVKEQLKDWLFQEAVSLDRTVALVIDDGQRLPGFGLEILRELLNYETNEAKLLQIVVFAQEALGHVLRERANLTDRIACLHHLSPLGPLDTVRLIRFRLARAGGEDPSRIGLLPALAVWWLSGGVPRQVVTLCDRVLLVLAVQDAEQASLAAVLACGRRLAMPLIRPRPALALVLVLVLVLILALGGLAVLTAGQLVVRQAAPPSHPGPSPVAAPRQPALPAPAPAPSPVTTTAGTVVPPGPVAPPALPAELGVLELEAGDILSKMIARVYGRFTPAHLALVRQANPQIADSGRLKSGTPVHLPAKPPLPPAPGVFRLQVAAASDLATAYRFLRAYPESAPPLALVPQPGAGGGWTFLVWLEAAFPDGPAAEAARQQLPDLYRASAVVLPPAPATSPAS